MLFKELFGISDFNGYIKGIKEKGLDVSEILEELMERVNFIDLTNGETTEIDKVLDEIEISGINPLELIKNLRSNLDFLLNDMIGTLNDELQREGRIILVRNPDVQEELHLYFVKTGNIEDFIKFIDRANEVGIHEIDTREFGVYFCGFLEEGCYSSLSVDICSSDKELASDIEKFFRKRQFEFK